MTIIKTERTILLFYRNKSKNIIEKSRPTILIEVFKKNLDKLNEWCQLNKYKIESLKGEDYLLEPQ